MKILVCMSVVPETTTKVKFTDGNSKFDTAGVQYIINPYDELALSKALEIAEANSGTVTIINVGGAENDAVLRKGLAMGATEAIRVDSQAMDAYFVAEQIVPIAKEGAYDFILTGRESIDYNSGQVCGFIAEMMELPSVNVICTLEINGNTATMVKDIDGGRETVKCNLPFVASAQKDLIEPRIPNMRGIMAARSKPLNVIPVNGTEASTSFENFELPEGKGAVKLIDADNATELINLLKNEAKVI